MAISMGTYQIMGFNHKICGYGSPIEMFMKFKTGEPEQLKALVNYLVARKLTTALRQRDWNKIELKYNGGGQGGAYAHKMEKHYNKLIQGKWKDWKPPQGGQSAPDIVVKPESGVTGGKMPKLRSGGVIGALLRLLGKIFKRKK